jgi:hypothetical protein
MVHDHDLDPAAWTDEPGSQPARDAHDDGAEQRRPETRNVEPVAQQGYRSEHPGTADAEETSRRVSSRLTAHVAHESVYREPVRNRSVSRWEEGNET